jgi:hypothetical protein
VIYKVLTSILRVLLIWSVMGALLGLFIIGFGKIVDQEYKNVGVITILIVSFGLIGLFQMLCMSWNSIKYYIQLEKRR